MGPLSVSIIEGRLHIQSNDVLKNLDGLNKLTNAGDLRIETNPLLISTSGLNELS